MLIDTDKDGATTARFRVEGIPTVVVLDGSGAEQTRGAPLTAGAMLDFLSAAP